MDRAGQLGVIEGVQRLAEFEHHVIGDIDECGNGAHAATLDALLHPVGCRRCGIHTAHDAAAVARTGSRRVEYDATGIGKHGGNRLDGGQCERCAGQRRDFARDADERQAVSTVRREFERDQRVIESKVAADVLADGCIGRQGQQAAVIRGQPEFARRTEHAETLDAAHLGFLDCDARQLRADQCAGYDHVLRHIRRAANDLQHAVLAGIDFAEFQLVSIGMLLGRQHARDDHIGKVGAGRTALLDFEAGHRQQMAQLVGRKRGIDEGAQPGFGKLHGY